jgi:DNA repair protein SbcC/Rad50
VFCVICGSILLPVGQTAYRKFAALLRDCRVVIAEQERALFDCLTLELSPAFPGDNLIAAKITRTCDGKAVVTPFAFCFEDGRAIAA